MTGLQRDQYVSFLLHSELCLVGIFNNNAASNDLQDVVLPRWLIDLTAQRPEFKYWLSVVMGENGHLDVGKVFALLSSSGLSREGLEKIWNAAREDAIPRSPLTLLQIMTTLAMIAIVQVQLQDYILFVPLKYVLSCIGIDGVEVKYLQCSP